MALSDRRESDLGRSKRDWQKEGRLDHLQNSIGEEEEESGPVSSGCLKGKAEKNGRKGENGRCRNLMVKHLLRYRNLSLLQNFTTIS